MTKKKQLLKRWLLVGLVIFHFTLIVINTISFFLLPFYTPWFVAVPLMSFIFRLATINDCPLTKYENVLRRDLGLRYIRSFISTYIWKPIRWGRFDF